MITKKRFHNLIELSLSDRKAELWAKITARDSAVERNEEKVTSSAFRPSIRVLTAVATCCLAVIITLAVVLPGLITPGESSQPSLSELGYKPYDPTIPTVDMSTVEIRGESFTPDSVDGRVLWFGCGTPEFPRKVYSYYDTVTKQTIGYKEKYCFSNIHGYSYLYVANLQNQAFVNTLMLGWKFKDGVKVVCTKIENVTLFYIIEETAEKGYYAYRGYFDFGNYRYFVSTTDNAENGDVLIGLVSNLLGQEKV